VAGQQAEHRHRLQLRELAEDLLLGASRQLSRRFNHQLHELMSKTLPLFTEGRYQHLQIDEQLTVRAFSREKQDFLDLDEISSGTQRQIMLALRLALSQELVNRVVQGPQFVFLDEPFAFFDEQRTRAALAVLPTLSAEITQVWVVSQAFPEELPLARRIRCERDRDARIEGWEA
jgi:exonuclease SbcC